MFLLPLNSFTSFCYLFVLFDIALSNKCDVKTMLTNEWFFFLPFVVIHCYMAGFARGKDEAG